MENVNKQLRNFISLSELKYGPLKFSFIGGFAYNWQSKWVGVIAIRTETTQIVFLSDVLVASRRWTLKSLFFLTCASPGSPFFIWFRSSTRKKIGCFPSQGRGSLGRFTLLRAIVFVSVLLLLLLLQGYQIGWLKFKKDGLLIVSNYTFIHPPQNVLMSAAPRMARVT